MRKVQLDRESVIERVRDRSTHLVTGMASILQGGVLSAAGFGLIQILLHPVDLALRLMLWCVNLVVSFIIYFRLAIRAPFITRSGAEVFAMMPLMGVLEIILFAVLTFEAAGSWRYWFFVAIAMTTVGVVTNLATLQTERTRGYAPDAEPVRAF